MNLSSSATIIFNCITVEFVCTLLHENFALTNCMLLKVFVQPMILIPVTGMINRIVILACGNKLIRIKGCI